MTDITIIHPAAGLARALGNALVHASADKARPVLAAVKFERIDAEPLRLVGCDSYGLMIEELPLAEVVGDDDVEVLIDVDDVKAMVRLLKPAKDAPACLKFTDTDVTVSVFGSAMTAPLVQGDCPPYRRLLPDRTDTPAVKVPTAIAAWQLAKLGKMIGPDIKSVKDNNNPPVLLQLGQDNVKPVRFDQGATIFGCLMPMRVKTP